MTAPLAGPGARFRRSVAVVVGIDRYEAEIPALRSAVRDARAVAAALEVQGFETIVLVDAEADRRALIALLEERLPAELATDDRLVFYFAGHGIALDSDRGPAGFLIPAGATRVDRTGFLEMQQLHRSLNALPIRHALVILDCCFAGVFRWASMRDVKRADGVIYRERYDRYVQSAAWQALTSASGRQLALDMLSPSRGEVDDGHSPFARALLAGLAGAADYTGDNLITADELALYVREQVAPAAEAVGRRQIPQLLLLDRHDDGQFVFQVPQRALALSPAPPLDQATNPYRGLESFREEDRAMFFGREAALAQLVTAARSQPLTVVVGPSGCGKSSLVQAGLLPVLRAVGWTVVPTQRPGREPQRTLAVIKEALAARTTNAADPASAADLASAAPCVVVIDQLEELDTLSPGSEDRAAFLGVLAAALAGDQSLHIVVTVRADAEPAFHDSALKRWWTAGARSVVPAVTRDELRDIIRLPPRAVAMHFEPSSLVDRLIDDVALVPAPLPLLSFALSELYRRCWARWQAGEQDRSLRETDYGEMGSVARALTQRASSLHAQLVAEDSALDATTRHVFTRMVATIGGERARRRLILDELDYGEAENRRVAVVLQRFHEARLIALGTETAIDGTVRRYAEPTHDELVRGWVLIGRWLDEFDHPPGTRALLGFINVAVQTWRAERESKALLWTDPRIEVAARLGHDRPLIFNAAESRFVAQSARRRRLRRRIALASVTGFVTVVTVVALVALGNARRANRESDNARRSLAQTYKGQGHRLLTDGRPLEALPYLAEALRNGADPVTTNILLAQATRNVPTAILPQEATVTGAEPSPDGTRILVAAGSSVSIYDADALDHAPVVLDGGGPVLGASFSPDGARIAARTSEHVVVWDTATRAQLATWKRESMLPMVPQVAWSCDGAQVWTAARDGTQVYTIADASSQIVDPAKAYWVEASPDCETIAVIGAKAVLRSAKFGSPWTSDAPDLQAAAFGARGALFAQATREELQLLDTHTREIHTKVATRASLLAFSPDGARLATATTDMFASSGDPPGRISIWDTRAGTLVGRIEHGAMITAMAFSPDGKQLASASEDRTIRLWTREGAPVGNRLEHDAAVTTVRFAPGGTRLVSSTSRRVWVWDVADDGPLRPARLTGATPLAVTPDGRRVAVIPLGGPLAITAVEGEGASVAIEAVTYASTAQFSPDGRRLLIDGESTKLWTEGGGPPVDLKILARRWTFLDPRGDRVLVEGVGDLVLWDAVRGVELQRAKRMRWWSMSPGAELVCVEDEGHISIWRVATGASSPLNLGRLEMYDTVAVDATGTHALAITSEGFRPVEIQLRTRTPNTNAFVLDETTPMERTAGVLDARMVTSGPLAMFSSRGDALATIGPTGHLFVRGARHVVLPHGSWIVGAAFSPDGHRIATLGAGAVRMWDLAGQLLGSSRISDSATTRIEFSANGRFLIAHHGRRVALLDGTDGSIVLERTMPLFDHTTWLTGNLGHAAVTDDATRVMMNGVAWPTVVSDGDQPHWDASVRFYGVDAVVAPERLARAPAIPVVSSIVDPYARRSNLVHAALAALPHHTSVARTLMGQVASVGLEQRDPQEVALASSVQKATELLASPVDEPYRVLDVAIEIAVKLRRPDDGLALVEHAGSAGDALMLAVRAELLAAAARFEEAATSARDSLAKPIPPNLTSDDVRLRLMARVTLIASLWARGLPATGEVEAVLPSYRRLRDGSEHYDYKPLRIGLESLSADRAARITKLLDLLAQPKSDATTKALAELLRAR